MKRAAFILAVVASILFLLSGPGTRAGWFGFGIGLRLFALSLPISFVALILSLVVVARERRLTALSSLALLASTFLTVIPATRIAQAFRAPPIHDVTTDPADPPQFVAALALRGPHTNPIAYGGPSVAAMQRKAWPDIAPLNLPNVAPAVAFGRAMKAANAAGLSIIAAVPTEGRIEATATTAWFGFKDDVVIRVRPAGAGSRIDVRSLSRVGRGDSGENARRVRALLRLMA
jgi:uncharacterized protein (DUF1499 family)